jgi:CubicO group peptidase (beta-lactamase class C family)
MINYYYLRIMMFNKSLHLFFCLFLAVTLAGQTSRLESEINKIITFDSDISYELTPGFIVGVVDGDSTYYVSFGKHRHPFTGKIGEDDVFEIGSITKTITATLIMVLVENEKLSLSDKFNKFLPLEYQNPRLKDLTIEQMVNHKTKFSKRPTMFGEKEDDAQNPYGHYSKQDLLEFYKNYVPEKSEEFSYSHTNYALLEFVIEAACNCDFNTAMEVYLFSELNMKNSFVELKEKKDDVISPGADRSLNAVPPWTYASFAPSEGVKSSAADLIAFMRPFMSMSKTTFDDYFPALTRQNNLSFNDKLFYSTGWHGIKINKKTKALVSNGNTNGHSAFIGMVPETKTGVVVLSNSSYGTKDLGLLILRMINFNWKRKAQ